MDGKEWEQVVRKVLDFAGEFGEFWEGEYAVLLSTDEVRKEIEMWDRAD